MHNSSSRRIKKYIYINDAQLLPERCSLLYMRMVFADTSAWLYTNSMTQKKKKLQSLAFIIEILKNGCYREYICRRSYIKKGCCLSKCGVCVCECVRKGDDVVYKKRAKSLLEIPSEGD